MRRDDFFRRISEFPHNLAVFTTYTIDEDVIKKLREHSLARTLVLHDKMQGFTPSSGFENRLCMRPAKWGNEEKRYTSIFHPKIGLLIGKDRAEDKAVLCIGSANLSRDSFEQSKDVCAWIEVERDSSEMAKLIDWLSCYLPTGWESLAKELRSCQTGNRSPEKWRFVQNKDEALSKGILSLIRDVWKMDTQLSTCHIASPFWANVKHRSEVQGWLHDLSAKQYYAYSRFNKAAMLFANENVNLKFPKRGKDKENFHSKLIMLEWEVEKTALLFVGSANFTHEGFFLSEKDGGNVECGLVIKFTDAEYNMCRRWFEDGWQEPIKLTEEAGKDLPEGYRSSKAFQPYAWAESDLYDPRVSLHVVAEELPTVKVVGQKKERVNLKLDGEPESGIFTYFVPDRFKHEREGEIFLRVILNQPPELDVPIFEWKRFEAAYFEDGCDVFKTDLYLLRGKAKSSRRSVLQRKGNALNLASHIIDPPDLEGFHRLWRSRFESLRDRSSFSMKHLEDLDQALNILESGKGFYVASALERLTKPTGNDAILSRLSNYKDKFMGEIFKSPEEAGQWKEFETKREGGHPYGSD